MPFLFDEDALLDEDVVVCQEDLSLEALVVFEESVSGLEGLLIGLEVTEVGGLGVCLDWIGF